MREQLKTALSCGVVEPVGDDGERQAGLGASGEGLLDDRGGLPVRDKDSAELAVSGRVGDTDTQGAVVGMSSPTTRWHW